MGIGRCFSNEDQAFIIRTPKLLLSGRDHRVDVRRSHSFAGALTQNTRRVWYMRNTDTVVVHDTLAAGVPHTYEWNFHTLAPIVANRTLYILDDSGRITAWR